MKILVVGSGGREHALAWKIRQSPRVTGVFCAPGNGGTRRVAENIAIPDIDIPALADFAAREHIGLTVVGPEVPLTLGIVDEFESRGLPIFGPSKKAAELEGSKIFAKMFLDRHRIPTGRFKAAYTPEEARAVVASEPFGYPLVVKADGLAAGKGVLICRSKAEAEEAVRAIMVEREFGAAGQAVLFEEFLRGQEVSFIVISDGVHALPLVTTMDHKAVFDGGGGPNTGGMGTISPSPAVSKKTIGEVMAGIIQPTITRMREEQRPFKGALYAGLMMTAEGPKVLEFNCRFGDPETQPQMLRLQSDLVEILAAAVAGDVLAREVEWTRGAAGCLILASGGYPGPYEKGKIIQGLEEAERLPGIVLFHAGTKFENGRYVTSGGRVLGVGAADRTLAGAMTRIYRAAGLIRFDGMHYRRDIGKAGAGSPVPKGE
ncbi:MAG: phosphoribosylamine--glycine ligase [Candidatus Aminicenantes bacterium]|nr:phosphoribosylamine--glycine ligase [Candidatus Aminicenantes bacterium]